MWILVAFLTIGIDLVNTIDLNQNFFNLNCGSELSPLDTDCYFKNSDDGLEASGENGIYYIPKNSIFFTETTCNGGLSYLQACSVESAAKAHPNHQINILFLGPVAKLCLLKTPLWDLVSAYPNIRVHKVFLHEFLKETPLEDFVRNGTFLLSKFPVNHADDIMKYATLHKFGGIHLNLDVIIAKPLSELPQKKNWIGRQGQNLLSTSLLALDSDGLGHIISEHVLKLLNIDFKPNSLEHSKTGILNKVLQIVCGVKDISSMTVEKCKGFKIYEPELFFPVPFTNYLSHLKEHHSPIPADPFAFHIYKTQVFTVHEDSFFAKLVESYCPKIAKLLH